MVHLKFTSLLLGLLLSMVAFWGPIVLAHREVTSLARNDDHAFWGAKELHDKEVTVAAAAKKWIRGRKMGPVDDAVKNGVLRGKENTGANTSVGKCGDVEKGQLVLDCEPSNRGLLSRFALVGLILKDYHSPKSHPPKNN